MPKTYKYIGKDDGTWFPSIGWAPKPGDTITVDEPIHSPLVEEVTASTETKTQKAEVTK